MLWNLLIHVSIFLVVVVLHSLYEYLKATYTTKTQRDVGRFHHDKYQEILHELKQKEPPSRVEFLSDQVC